MDLKKKNSVEIYSSYQRQDTVFTLIGELPSVSHTPDPRDLLDQ